MNPFDLSDSMFLLAGIALIAAVVSIVRWILRPQDQRHKRQADSNDNSSGYDTSHSSSYGDSDHHHGGNHAGDDHTAHSSDGDSGGGESSCGSESSCGGDSGGD